MSACSYFLLASRKEWNAHPWSCSQNLNAFLSKPHYAYPRGSFSRRLRSAENVSSSRIYLESARMHTSSAFTVTRPLKSFTSFHLERSSLLTHSKHGRRSLAARSAVDLGALETDWTPLIKACFSEGGGCSKLLSVLSGIFSDLSSNNSLYSAALATTILGVSGAFYAYASREGGDNRRNLLVSERGQFESLDDWLNLSRATPFNRFVTRRCPSLAPSSATRNTKQAEAVFKMEPKPPQYQRLCLHCHDGGTMAVDWPSHLDLEKSKELDNVLLIIPGSTEGSEEEGIGRFTRVAEQRGYFPVVLNPRGCGGSPLTTPRVFSAADSDDVSVVAHYIAKRRPWASIMGIGWGFGANMLSKYLGEEAYATPLTAAVCIDNPYNLDKVTQSVTASRWNDLDQALTNGLTKILDANQKLFQGESKGFDVNGGLAARSLREFETAISIVAHGYDSVQKFYSDVSSEVMLERVQIPLLCVQHVQDYIGHQISISQRGFEKNPYIMLLVSPPTIGLGNSPKGSNFPGTASEWSHDVALEWLAAVEVALLKGRHPLLDVVDLTVKPTKEWSPVGSQITATASAKKVSEPAATTIVSAPNSYGMVDSGIIDVTGDISDSSEHSKLGSQEPSPKSSVEAREEKVNRDNDLSRNDHAVIAEGYSDAVKTQTGHTTEAHSEEEKKKVETAKSSDVVEEDSSEELERGQVQLAAESVMKVLDVTMPGTLSAQQKQQVLEAVGRGESLVGALQEAVPDDVRGKMASAVSAVVQAKGISLKTAGFGEKMPAPMLPDGLTESIKAKLGGLTGSSGDSSPETKSSENGKKVENAALSESAVHERSVSKAEKNSTVNAGSDGGKSNADLNEEKVARDGSTRHGTSEEHTERNATTGMSSDENKMSDDIKTDTTVVQGEHATVAGSDPSQDTKTNTDGNKSADDLKKEAEVPHVEQASHVSFEDNVGQAQETKASFNDQKVKSEKEPGEKGRSTASTAGQSRESDAAPDSRNTGDVRSNDQADVVTADSPVASGQEQDKKNEQEPGSTERRGMSEHKDEPSKQESATPTQTENNDQTSETSQFNGEVTTLQTEEAQQKPPSEVPAAEISVAASSPTPPPASQVPPVPSVGQALQALTGFDDATQMAVTNVFGVVENVLDQLEKDNPPVENGSTVSENQDQEETNRRKASTSENAYEMGDSDSTSDPQKYTLDVSKCDSGEEHGKEVDCVTRDPAEVKQVPTNGSYAGNQVPLTSKKIPDEIRSSVDQIGLSENYQGCKDEGTGQIEDHGAYHSGHSASLLDETRGQAQPSGVSSGIQHSPAYPEDENEGRLAAISVEIDKEDQSNAEKTLEEDIVENAQRKDTNSGGENQNMVRDVVMNALKLEVVRRLGGAGLDALGLDLEKEMSKVAHAVAEAVKQGQERVLDLASNRDERIEGSEGSEAPASSGPDSSTKLGILDGNSIVRTLGTVLSSGSSLTSFIPLGVLVGVVLAALGALFLIVTDDEQKTAHALSTSSPKSVKNDPTSSEFDELDYESPVGHISVANGELDKRQSGGGSASEKLSSRKKDNARAEDSLIHPDTGNEDKGPNHGKLIGAVTAAMGATAAVASQSEVSTAVDGEEVHLSQGSKTDGSKADSVHDSGDGDGLPEFVPGIAGKAVSMVSPVVPKKEDGEVDQDRLVAMLAEIGQKGGILALVGKAALLWGGLRGAMSLADRLLGFLRIKDRPLLQRLLGFVGMTILLWTPVLVPLLPTLLQQWSTKSPSGVADAGAGIGLYGAIFIVIVLWGKRVRGYDRPLVSYGLELLSRAKLRFLAVGMAVGVNLVTAYYGVNWVLGYITFSWGSLLVENPSFPGPAATAILTFWKLFSLIGQSVSMALIVALVEELLFRAWLQEEIAVDLGNHWGIVLSALAFAVVHWSPPAVVGLWFLAVALAGARSRMDGDLSLSIGIHAGIVSAFSVVNLGGLTNYLPSAPAWLTGAYAENPLAGALGTAMVAALAIALYPQKQALPPAEDDDCDVIDDS